MGDWSKKVMARIRDRLENEVDSIGVEMVADIRTKISTPVVQGNPGEGMLSPKTGWWIVERSSPYSYPWLETGELRDGERHELATSGPIVTLSIINDSPHARIVHDGHGPSGLSNYLAAEPRPFHDLAMIEWRTQILERARESILGKR